jgi:putative hydrolase
MRDHEVMAQEPFGDVPLFRELQKVLAASEGPINLEIARQVAAAIATQGLSDTDPGPEEVRAYAEGVRVAEQVLSGYTRMAVDEPIQTRLIGRAEWIASTLDGWRWLLQRTAERFGSELDLWPGAEEGEGAGEAMQATMGQVAPLLMGLQVGMLIGHLARDAIGRYDLSIPREDDGKLFVVAPNVSALADDYGLDVHAVYRWLAIRDAARHIIATAVPWVKPYARSLLLEVVDAVEIDTSDIERRFMDLQTKGIEAFQEEMGDTLPLVQTERHERALARLQAFVALFEGYAAHAAGAVSGQVTDETPQIDEAMSRRATVPTTGAKLLGGVLGLSVDRDLDTAGQTFCAAVAQLHGLQALGRVWEAPDNLPSLDEVKDPFAWMERVLGE